MKQAKALIFSIVLMTVLHGCTATWQNIRNVVKAPEARYREMAINYEEQDELQQALFAWHIVAQLNKDNAEAIEAIKRLEQTATKAAHAHFQRGRKHFNAGNYEEALKEFLTTIRYTPHHRQARIYLKKRLQNPDQATYKVQSGDSFVRIASKVYKDPSKAYIIAYFNDLNPRKTLLIGTTLLLPTIDQIFLQTRSNISILLGQAYDAYERNQYDETISFTQKILAIDPQHAKARKLANAAHFNKGMDLFRKKRYLAAVEQFELVSSNYKGRNQIITKARSQIKKTEVDEKLVQARAHLRNNAWESVINVTKEILDHDRDNAQAKMLFSNASYNLAKSLLERDEVVNAATLLEGIDPSYEDTGQLLSTARARMKSQAETHYREGVKHFINENLELAIQDWKRALELNPDHPKARQDIEKARRLLDKLQELEKE